MAMEMEHIVGAMLHPRRHVTALPQQQFEACRVLRAEHWSHYKIACALGISLSQVRVAVDPKASASHERWAA